jgi:hypothetical protein
MTECRLSGDDSILKNVWEEFCVQLQGEHSVFWSTYEDTIRIIVEGHVAELPRFEAEAVYLQTDHVFDNPPDENRRAAIYEEAMVEMIIRDYVYRDADNWSNSHIRAYMDRPTD